MKTFNIAMLALMMALSFVSLTPVYAEVSQAAEDHLALAASYEQKAQAQDTLIAEHQQMKKDYPGTLALSPKDTSSVRVQEMDKHCDAIIQDATKLRNEFLEFAKWHQMRAAELQGR